MKNIRILIIYSRDIEINDSGASRTTIQLADYISKKEGFECYCFFRIINGQNKNITEITDRKLSIDNLNKVIKEKDIDILLVPEAYRFAKLAHDAVKGTNCKVVSALHSKPGYERIGVFTLLKESMLYNEHFIRRIKALMLIMIYPITYFLYTRSIGYHFRKAYEYSDYLVLLSESYFKQFQNIYKIINTDKFISIGNSLSFDYFATEPDILKKKKKILVVSRLDERTKRLSLILKAWKKIQGEYPDWSLDIVGFGRSLRSYLKLVKKLDLKRIQFLGKRQPEVFYKESSIFLMTSAFEGWGMTITEAQQYGCVPIVMESFSAVHDIIESDVNGIISPNSDLDSFISNIKKIIENEELRIQMALNGIEGSKRFTKDIVCEKWIELFLKIVYDEDSSKINDKETNLEC
ncbi:glycosyltransferase [Robertmurraya sp. GLU-23]